MSTTTNREVSMMYASQPGKPGLIFEMQMGMACHVDRTLDFVAQMATTAVARAMEEENSAGCRARMGVSRG